MIHCWHCYDDICGFPDLSDLPLGISDSLMFSLETKASLFQPIFSVQTNGECRGCSSHTKHNQCQPEISQLLKFYCQLTKMCQQSIRLRLCTFIQFLFNFIGCVTFDWHKCESSFSSEMIRYRNENKLATYKDKKRKKLMTNSTLKD